MNIAFCLMVANMLKKIYAGRPDDYAEALHRHSAFFNITPQLAPFVGGIAMAMEEKVARGEVEPESVNDIKAALMGPLSGLGDSFFLSTLRVVAAAVGISLCQAGNAFGPIAFLLIYNIPAFLLKFADGTVVIQDILDGIMPGMLGMAAFWLYYWLLSKKINPMVLILCTMVVGIIGAYFGVLA